ncbi:alpha/beta hydrolase family esterase [Thalassospira profundimaris]|uniref:extracellular catalytic domain type 1 short-chain-length polyhydroxyalkanoate depolymerase n=1 Tax=Thalassospira profundimaris TaxID=502049 RepID=UPI0002873981|nr:PHB depolymerase family esterase [Thalassospira profundimaris]EKF09783.1 esterase, PHB depolymerase [Thalassospira profundimaris WP0211]
MRSLINALATLMNPFAYVGDDALPTERLSTLGTFGANPGLLRALTYIPQDLPKAAPLVIVLHGCKQTAERYDDGSGWSDLADRHGFALLFPEQRRVNNWLLGFNWFRPRDNTRGSGEPLSIMHMVEQVVRDHGIDRQRIFITGLSAGGAMTSVMLATYPELFAGGAIIAGLPYGCADTTRAAFRSMKGRRGGRTAGQLAPSLRRASGHEGPWPTISIWHGGIDGTVHPSNASAILKQWLKLHKLSPVPTRAHIVDGYPRRVWKDADGHEVLEEFRITGMGHGTPIKAGGPNGCGSSGDYMLDVNISSTRHIASFWGLMQADAANRSKPRASLSC